VTNETVSFFINDKEYTSPKGQTVMATAFKEGVYIPHFCWHPGLPIAGVCRFCLVKVEGRPKLEIACNLQPTPGMKVYTQQPEVSEAHKWALEFHLVNHPLDCPICDQAGECKLQDFYMEVGKYKSQMERPKVLKPKALDIGDDLVLDTERCILCDRCVRFEETVTKTSALGIFNRGDRSVIGTYPDRKIHHNYQDNLVDICPVGAFTSRDFRFKQRVWFLKDKPAVCPGCSTGCAVDVYGKPEVRTYFRVKPREDQEVNGLWMCDVGRKTYKHLNQEHRLRAGIVTDGKGRRRTRTDEAVAVLATQVAATDASDIALLVSPQYTTEEYASLFDYFVRQLGVKKVFQWREPTEKLDDFDGILYRGDHNPNTGGLAEALKAAGLPDGLENGFEACVRSGAKLVVALAPELSFQFPSLDEQLGKLEGMPFVSLWTIDGAAWKRSGIKHALPMTGFAEKRGTFKNYAGKVRELAEPFPSAAEEARSVTEAVTALAEVVARVATAPAHIAAASSGQKRGGVEHGRH
jgi:NADH-quinone oxidoreductase subunit G